MLQFLTDVAAYVYWGFFSSSVAGNSDIVVKQYKVGGVLVRFAASTHRQYTGSACRTASLDHCSHPYPCLGNLLVYFHILHETFPHCMLCHSHHQFPLLHSNGAGVLSDMSPFRLQLEPVHSRNMWRPKVFGSVHRGIQFVDGHNNRGITASRFVGASDADRKKIRFERPVLHGYSVRMTFQPQLSSAKSAI